MSSHVTKAPLVDEALELDKHPKRDRGLGRSGRARWSKIGSYTGDTVSWGYGCDKTAPTCGDLLVSASFRRRKTSQPPRNNPSSKRHRCACSSTRSH